MKANDEFPSIVTIVNNIKSRMLLIEENIEKTDLETKDLINEAKHYIEQSEKITNEMPKWSTLPFDASQEEIAEKTKLLDQSANKNKIKMGFEKYDTELKTLLENQENEIKKLCDGSAFVKSD